MAAHFPEFIDFPNYRVGSDGTVTWTKDGANQVLQMREISKDGSMSLGFRFPDAERLPCGKRKEWNLKKVVYEAFIGESGLHTIAHRDKDWRNCAVDNLFLSNTDKVDPEMLRLCQAEYAQKPGYALGRFPYSRYSATADGKIVNMYSDTEVKGTKIGKYLSVALQRDDEPTKVHVGKHRIVHFFHDPSYGLDSGLEVNHIDGDTLNNAASNLEALTRREHNEKTSAANPDKQANAAKKRCKPVIRVDKTTGEITHFPSFLLAHAGLGVTESTLTASLNGDGDGPGNYIWSWDVEHIPGERWHKIIRDMDADWAPKCLVGAVGICVSTAGRVRLPWNGRFTLPEKKDLFSFGSGDTHRRLPPLVCYMYWGQPPTSAHVHASFLDGDSGNLDPRNLCWMTAEGKNRNSKAVKAVRQTNLVTGQVTEHPTSGLAAKACGCAYGTLAKICKNGTPRAGSRWEFFTPVRRMRDIDMPEPDSSIAVPVEVQTGVRMPVSADVASTSRSV